jgi:hypothetical protein
MQHFPPAPLSLLKLILKAHMYWYLKPVYQNETHIQLNCAQGTSLSNPEKTDIPQQWWEQHPSL